MDFRTKLEELIKQGRLLLLVTTNGGFIGRMKGFHPKDINSVELIPVDILSSSTMRSLKIPIETIEEINTIADGKIIAGFKAESFEK